MAADPTTNDSSPVDYRVAVKDYSLLIALLKWGGVTALIIGFVVMIILAN